MTSVVLLLIFYSVLLVGATLAARRIRRLSEPKRDAIAGQEHELHLYRDGKWRDDTETWYWPKDVLTDFTGHRTLGAVE